MTKRDNNSRYRAPVKAQPKKKTERKRSTGRKVAKDMDSEGIGRSLRRLVRRW